MTTLDRGPGWDGQQEVDSVERLVSDLRRLKERSGRTLDALAKTARISRTSIHDATTKEHRLPSANVVRRLALILDPDDVDRWEARRDRLDPKLKLALPSAAPVEGAEPAPDPEPHGGGEPQPIKMTPDASGSQRLRRRWSNPVLAGALAVGALAVGMLAASPHSMGGVSALAYCESFSQSRVGDDAFAHGKTYDSLRCILGDGTVEALDVQRACQQEYPAVGPFGGAQYAGHIGPGWADWQCYGSLLHVPG